MRLLLILLANVLVTAIYAKCTCEKVQTSYSQLFERYQLGEINYFFEEIKGGKITYNRFISELVKCTGITPDEFEGTYKVTISYLKLLELWVLKECPTHKVTTIPSYVIEGNDTLNVVREDGLRQGKWIVYQDEDTLEVAYFDKGLKTGTATVYKNGIRNQKYRFLNNRQEMCYFKQYNKKGVLISEILTDEARCYMVYYKNGIEERRVLLEGSIEIRIR